MSLGPGQRLPHAVVLAPRAPNSGNCLGPPSLQVRRVGLAPRQKWGWPSCTCGFRALPACLQEQCPHSETGPRIQHAEQPTLLPSQASQPWRSSTPPGLVYGSPWVWLGLWGGSSPPTDALIGPSASRLQSRARHSVLASELVSPRGAVQGGHGRQAGRFCTLSTARGGRAGCLLYRSTRLWVCTQPRPGLRNGG